ncbi:MAG: hypothetical protein E1N59_2549 [Puniceicoccaceae bacterium 5H]|nr:MAG: hypothetical protein E1N59_2549 [Puniceicoccaceae bacterium 5H]
MAKSFRAWHFGVGVLVILVGIQFVPVAHTNPPVEAQPQWDSPETEGLARAACFDCHSNETEWPWYSYVAPVSWWTVHHVEEGRSMFNMSEEGFGRHADDAAEEVEEGEMPIWPYDWAHAGARLSEEERAQLVQGLRATFGGEGHEGGEHEHASEEEAHEH